MGTSCIESLENARVGVYSGKERDVIRILVGELEKSGPFIVF